MERELKEKLVNVVELVDKVMVDPEINVEYFIPGVYSTAHSHSSTDHPYILIEYAVSEYTKPTRKIHLTPTYTQHDADKIAGLVTFSIEQFKTEIDSVEMG